MCMGCMANADFVLTSGILGAASLRVGARRFLPTARWARRVTDDEAQAFLASLAQTPPATALPADSLTADSHAAEPSTAEPSTADSHAAEPSTAEPSTADSHAADSVATEPTPAADRLVDHVDARADAHDARVLAAR